MKIKGLIYYPVEVEIDVDNGKVLTEEEIEEQLIIQADHVLSTSTVKPIVDSFEIISKQLGEDYV